MIAKEVYHLQEEVEELQTQINTAPPEKKSELQDRLRKVTAEWHRMRRILEGTKEPPSYRKL
jgi:peptidoglycan hydrolase CwlO-like protein